MSINTHQLKSFISHFFVAKRKGHGVHSPFAYKLCEEVFYAEDSFYAFKELEMIRKKILLNHTIIQIEDFGAGSKTMNSNSRKISDIATKGISSKKQSELLFKLSNFLNCKIIIELGTSLGLNTLYLAKVNSEAKIISIEGSKSLSDFASQLAAKHQQKNIEFLNATFDEALPMVFHKLNSFDLLYVDGNHTYEASLRYFEMALTKKESHSVVVFDDIYWSADMTKAWKKIKQHPAVRMSIDTFYFGMIFFSPEIKERVELKLYI